MTADGADERRALIDNLIQMLQVDIDQLRLQTTLSEYEPADIAEALEDLPPEVKLALLDSLNAEQRAEVLEESSSEDVSEYLQGRPVEQLAEMIEAMPADDAADFLDQVDAQTAEMVIAKLEPEHAEELRGLLEYPDDSAGGIMTTEFFAAQPHETAGEIVSRIRQQYEEVETVHYLFVIGKDEQLAGKIDVEDLIAADPERRASELMDKAVITIGPFADQEIAARYMHRYDLSVLPVVDGRRRLLGIITFDDVLDVMNEEASEDMYRMAGVGADKPLEQGTMERAYKRLPWLVTTILGSGLIIPFLINGLFAHTLATLVILALFIPAIMGLGGNAAIQSSTIVVRALAMGELEFDDLWWMLGREMKVALILAVTCSISVGVCAYGLYSVRGVPSGPDSSSLAEQNPSDSASTQHITGTRFGLTVGFALFVSIMLSVVIGTMMPMLCHRVGIDPALAAGPFITTAIDIGSQTIYLGIATWALLT